VHTTVGHLKQLVYAAIATQGAWRPYRNATLDTMKMYTKAHGNKTSNLIINLDRDDWVFDSDDATLASLELENESEVSFFSRELYDAYKAHPETKWD